MEENKGLTGSTLKIIAIVVMLIDHIAFSLVYEYILAEKINFEFGLGMPPVAWTYTLMRLIGRVAFPIFIFLMIEGIQHTSNKWKYLGRMIIFAFISEIPFDMAFFVSQEDFDSLKITNFSSQNVYFTLAIGLLVLIFFEKLKEKKLPVSFVIAGMFAGITLGMLLAELLRTDYGCVGVLAIVTAYVLKDNPIKSAIGCCVALSLANTTELAAFIAVLPIALYSGERGLRLKWVFYLFYPVHLLVLGLLKMFLF